MIKNKNLESNFNKKSGITLISLVVAISVMIIISSLLIYNAKTGIKVRNLKMMQNDIELLNDKVEAYYVKYGALPISIKYNVSTLPFESMLNPNDSSDGYYVLDLKAFEGLTLNYGADFDKVTEENVADFNDIYIINEQSHQIYYARGIEMDGVVYYTNDTGDEVSLVENKWKKVIESGTTSMLGIDNMGNLYGLNANYHGTIKNNTNYITSNQLFPELKYTENINIIEIGEGIALDNQGKIYTWGRNYNGQLGNGTTEDSNIPICISDISGNILNGKKIIKVSGGMTAIDEEGKVYTWGDNSYGQLGNGESGKNLYSNVPICISDIPSNPLNNKNIVNIFASANHIIALDSQGKVYTWGSNDYGVLGNGTTEDSNIPICISDLPDNILNGKNIVEICTGSFNTAVIDEQGKVYIWGYNYYGQLGNGQYYSNKYTPICISDIEGNLLKGKRVVNISAGSYHTIAIDEEGKVYAWGDNSYGQLGNGTTGKSNIPICISDIPGNILNGKRILNSSTDFYFTVMIDDDGKVYTWGGDVNKEGLLGNGTTESSSIPICISDIPDNPLNGEIIIDIFVNFDHIIALSNQGKVYTWGNNASGQLGNGNNFPCLEPVQIFKEIINIIKDRYIVEISSNYYCTIALDNQGKVYTWGYVLGNGTISGSNMPICISDLPDNILSGKNIKKIYAGDSHAIVLDEQGKVYTWGNNENGQLGNGESGEGMYSNIPICISDLPNNILSGKNIVEISAGCSNTVALDDQGKVYTWGSILGNETEEGSNVPICISEIEGNPLNGKKIVKISSAATHTIAVDDQGKVYTWGNNENGQLGNGESGEGMYSNIPICISDISGNILNGKNIVAVSAGYMHTSVVDNQGKVYTWGNNENGQLGNGTIEDSNIPICISDISGNLLNGKKITEISTGYYHTTVIDDKGEVNIFGKYIPGT